LTAHIDWKQVIETLRAKFHTVKLPKSFVAVNLSEKLPQAFITSPDEAQKGGVAGDQNFGLTAGTIGNVEEKAKAEAAEEE